MSVAVPVLVRVTVWAALVVPTVCGAKVAELTLRLTAGANPVPANGMVCGLPDAELVTARVAIRVPPSLGVKVTLRLQLPPAFKELGQLLVCVKSEALVPVMVVPLRLRVALPEFTKVRTSGELALPRGSGGKFIRLGFGVRKGPFTPVPVSGILSGLMRVLSVRLIVPD